VVLTFKAVLMRMAKACVLPLGIGLLMAQNVCSASAQDTAADANLVARGKYVAEAADCKLCHTSASGKPFAGGYKIDTPFGPIYSTNLTPDPKTGIGNWTFEDFKRAMHDGIRPDGQYLYPAMPLNSYTKIVDDDLKAMWAYLRSIPPVQQSKRENGLRFPFDIREGMLVWRWLYFDEGYFEPDANRGPLWNRGAYIVQGLGHCGGCHTPRNFMGAEIKSESLHGAHVGDWYAPDITPKALKDTNKWDIAQLAAFLKKGGTRNSTAFGPMEKVVHASLSHLNDHDLEATATYLLNASEEEPAVSQAQPSDPIAPASDPSPAASDPIAPASDPSPAASDPIATASDPSPPAETALQRGGKLYSENCAECHQSNGEGIHGAVPPMADNPAVIAKSPTDIIGAIVKGVPPRGGMGGMPSFAGALSDQEIADIANYVRTSWGNRATPDTTANLVAAWRKPLTPPHHATDPDQGFVCPTTEPGGDKELDLNLIKDLRAEMRDHGVDYPRLVDMYENQRPKAGMAKTVDALVAAYCPIIAASDETDRAKAIAFRRFSLNTASYVMHRYVPESAPPVDIVWATPVGYTLAEDIPPRKGTLTCPANDGSLVPKPLVDQARSLIGTPDPKFHAEAADTQAHSLAAKNATAKLADVANALILSFCRGIETNSKIDPAQKEDALNRYGDEVIAALQESAESKAPPKAASKKAE
jgi:mono/diheme cytochrome c family protein